MNSNFHMLCGTGYTNRALRGSQLRGASPGFLQVHEMGESLRCLIQLKNTGKKIKNAFQVHVLVTFGTSV